MHEHKYSVMSGGDDDRPPYVAGKPPFFASNSDNSPNSDKPPMIARAETVVTVRTVPEPDASPSVYSTNNANSGYYNESRKTSFATLKDDPRKYGDDSKRELTKRASTFSAHGDSRRYMDEGATASRKPSQVSLQSFKDRKDSRTYIDSRRSFDSNHDSRHSFNHSQSRLDAGNRQDSRVSDRSERQRPPDRPAVKAYHASTVFDPDAPIYEMEMGPDKMVPGADGKPVPAVIGTYTETIHTDANGHQIRTVQAQIPFGLDIGDTFQVSIPDRNGYMGRIQVRVPPHAAQGHVVAFQVRQDDVEVTEITPDDALLQPPPPDPQGPPPPPTPEGDLFPNHPNFRGIVPAQPLRMLTNVLHAEIEGDMGFTIGRGNLKIYNQVYVDEQLVFTTTSVGGGRTPEWNEQYVMSVTNQQTIKFLMRMNRPVRGDKDVAEACVDVSGVILELMRDFRNTKTMKLACAGGGHLLVEFALQDIPNGPEGIRGLMHSLINCPSLITFVDSLVSNLFSQQTEIVSRGRNAEARFNWMRFFGGLEPDPIVGALLRNPEYSRVVNTYWPTILTGFAQGDMCPENRVSGVWPQPIVNCVLRGQMQREPVGALSVCMQVPLHPAELRHCFDALRSVHPKGNYILVECIIAQANQMRRQVPPHALDALLLQLLAYNENILDPNPHNSDIHLQVLDCIPHTCDLVNPTDLEAWHLSEVNMYIIDHGRMRSNIVEHLAMLVLRLQRTKSYLSSSSDFWNNLAENLDLEDDTNKATQMYIKELSRKVCTWLASANFTEMKTPERAIGSELFNSQSFKNVDEALGVFDRNINKRSPEVLSALGLFGKRVCEWALVNGTRMALKYTMINAPRFEVPLEDETFQQVLALYRDVQGLPKDWNIGGMVTGMRAYEAKEKKTVEEKFGEQIFRVLTLALGADALAKSIL